MSAPFVARLPRFRDTPHGKGPLPLGDWAAPSGHLSLHARRLGDLLVGIADPGGAADTPIGALALASAEVLPGALLIARNPGRTAGLRDLDEAARRGAGAVLADPTDAWPIGALAAFESRTGVPVVCVADLGARTGLLAARWFGEPAAELDTAGIAGAQAARVSYLLAQALEAELGCGLIGGLGCGLPGELRELAPSGLDALALQAELAALRARGSAACALDLTAPGLDEEALAALALDRVVLTGADPGSDREPDRRLLATPGLRWVVVNRDDPRQLALLAGLAPAVRVAAYGLAAGGRLPRRCDLWVEAQSVQTRPGGLRLAVHTGSADAGRSAGGEDSGEIEVPLVGTANAAALLAVLAVLLTMDLPLRRALRNLTRVRGVPGRMESFGGDEAPLVVVDDAHTPDALEKALTDLRLHRGRRVIAVFGCDGERDRGQRSLMGAVAERLADALILTDANPRREAGDAIVADILGGMTRPDAVRVERSRGTAIRRAIAIAGRDDAVLVAGRGRETALDVGGLQVHFSDRAQVVEALREWREGHH